jgi:copper homeostasis protein
MTQPKIEVCLDSTDSAIAAQEGGADRVELCDNLIEGGTTPSAGMITATRDAIDIGLMVMIRPRGGDFCYSPTEIAAMEHDVRIARELGADGVVFGVLKPEGEIDAVLTRRLRDIASGLEVTFHRAFDMTNDPFHAMETLIDSGVDRILTSGQEPSVLEGLDMLTDLVERADDRITIMPGCGITLRNMEKVAQTTKARELHVVGNEFLESRMIYRNPRVFMGTELRSAEYARTVTSAEAIRGLVERARS